MKGQGRSVASLGYTILIQSQQMCVFSAKVALDNFIVFALS